MPQYLGNEVVHRCMLFCSQRRAVGRKPVPVRHTQHLRAQCGVQLEQRRQQGLVEAEELLQLGKVNGGTDLVEGLQIFQCAVV